MSSRLLPILLLVALAHGGRLHAARPDFERDVAPLLAGRCLECHRGDHPSGGLDLSSAEGLRRGGDSGPAITADRPLEGVLWERVSAGEMPPESRGQSQRLPDNELATLRDWLGAGVPWPDGRRLDPFERTSDLRGGRDWWSLQPVVRPPVPLPRDLGRVATPVDAFIVERLDEAGMAPAPPADRATLIRRVTFDLHGLPPTLEEIEAFVADTSPDAWERLVDRLLASPRYGERWARHWLDVVRFAETCGYERDQLKPGIWRYRDWVIDAFNADLPYDQFVVDQLAGDERPGHDERSLIATGMLRAGTWNDEPNDPADYLYERLEDMVHTTSSAFLGLTVKCARCHDHKFDPIPQTDYYRLGAHFWSGFLGQANLGGPSKEELGSEVFGWTDRGREVEPIHLLIKGERLRPGGEVAPGFLSAVPALDRPLAPPAADSRTTGRRLQLARWLTDPRHPLTARVIVNRVWLHHFGEGLVRSPNNFGFKGELPTHPGLLDWLAAELVAPGGVPTDDSSAAANSAAWSLKRLHRAILLSNTYRQSSDHPRHDEYAGRDFGNRLWWHANRRRLDAESLRDALLAAGDALSLQQGGPSFYPAMSAEALEGLSRKEGAWKASAADQRARRSVYMIAQRSRLLPLMTTFDFTDTTLSCGQRDVTTVPTQALAMLNNDLAHEQSVALARRVERLAGDSSEPRIEWAWRLALGRAPSASEQQAAEQHLQQQAEHFAKLAELEWEPARGEVEELPVRPGLVWWLRADRGIDRDSAGRVIAWDDGASEDGLHPHDATQAREESRPGWTERGLGGRPALRFDGERTFLHVAGRVLWSQTFSLFAVARDEGQEGARELVSNWHRRGRSTNSVFLGTLGADRLRFSDAFAPAGQLQAPRAGFILSAFASSGRAATYQGRRRLAESAGLGERDLGAPYVIGTQGNYGHEWWRGEISELIAFDRELDEREREAVWDYLERRYGVAAPVSVVTPAARALESLCHVLLNTNEFLYVD